MNLKKERLIPLFCFLFSEPTEQKFRRNGTIKIVLNRKLVNWFAMR